MSALILSPVGQQSGGKISNQVEKKAGNSSLLIYVILSAVERAETPSKLSMEIKGIQGFSSVWWRREELTVLVESSLECGNLDSGRQTLARMKGSLHLYS